MKKQTLFYPLTILLLLATLQRASAQTKPAYPPELRTILNNYVGKIKPELEKAAAHFAQKQDSMQLKAFVFLLSHMKRKWSQTYFWVDSNYKKVAFNELEYPDFDSSIRAFEQLKQSHYPIHPVQNVEYDLQNEACTADMLIENVSLAYTDWQTHYPTLRFTDFCEYLLPYRISVEPLQQWRKVYKEKFAYLSDTTKFKNAYDKITQFTNDCTSWFDNTYGKEQRTDPFSRLGALNLLHRKKGACEDFTSLGVFIARSLGIPATVAHIPYWATSSDSHFFAEAILPNNVSIPFEALSKEDVTKFAIPREPGKVVRYTFSEQANTLANQVDKKLIPPGFLKATNYIDVTEKYWPVQNVATPLFKTTVDSLKAAIPFVCVFNKQRWCAIWHGTKQNDSAYFTKMGKGAVYLPAYYQNKQLVPAGYPIAIGYNHTQVLAPDTLHTHTVILKEQDRYLKYRPLKKYQLYYWNNSWRLIDTQTAGETSVTLTFNNVPKNALLLLVPEYTQRKERPFMITEKGERIWW